MKEYMLDLERKKELQQEAPGKTVQRDKDREEGIAATGLPVDPAKEKTFLAVPYKEKEQAKKLGAKWDKDNKRWYAPEGTDLTPLASWMPEKAPVPEPPMPPQEEFAQALEYCKERGLTWDGLYDIFDRVSCWCCPLGGVTRAEKIYHNFPLLWQRMLEMESWLPKECRRYTGNRTVSDLTKRFSVKVA